MADDANHDNTEKKDPAEALAGMADEERPEIVAPAGQGVSDPLSALTGMARGRRDAADDLGRLAGGGDEQGEAAPFAGGPAQARPARAAGHDRRRARAHAHAYKKSMIPFLIVVAAMLLSRSPVTPGQRSCCWSSDASPPGSWCRHGCPRSGPPTRE